MPLSYFSDWESGERRDVSVESVRLSEGWEASMADLRERSALMALGNPTRVLALRHASRSCLAMVSSWSSLSLISLLRYVHNSPMSFSLWNDSRTAVARIYHSGEDSDG